MKRGLPLGRIFGIQIVIDGSWLLIFLLVTWNLAAGVLPALHPGWNVGMRIGLAIIAALLFFASVLLHELAHSLVARTQGLPVRDITLFLFGGVATIEREPTAPRSEFLITIVGPLTSLAIGISCLLLGSLGLGDVDAALSEPADFYARLGPVATLLLWLGPLNLMLGLFNLLPGFPLDGGRLLRSALWAITGDFRRATRWASVAGQLVAWSFIVAGISMLFGAQLPFFGTGLVSGLWLIFIGWFLNSAAVQSYQQLVIHDLLAGVSVANLLRSGSIAAVRPTDSVNTLVHDWIMGTEERAFPVLDGDALVGLVCLEDVRKVPREAWTTTTVGAIMTPADQLAAIAPDKEASEALETLATRDVDQLPVVQDGHLVGMLRRRDILRWLQLHSEGAAI